MLYAIGYVRHLIIIKICKITTQETTQRDKEYHELDFEVFFYDLFFWKQMSCSWRNKNKTVMDLLFVVIFTTKYTCMYAVNKYNKSKH